MFWNNSLDAPFSGNSCVAGFYFLVGFRSSDARARLGAFPAVTLPPLHPCACVSAEAGGFFGEGLTDTRVAPPRWERRAAAAAGAAGCGASAPAAPGGAARPRIAAPRAAPRGAGAPPASSFCWRLRGRPLKRRRPLCAASVLALSGSCEAGSALGLPILPDLEFLGSFGE